MADLGQTVIDLHRQRLDNLRQRAAAAIGRLSDADVNWRPNQESNSIANLVLHLAGNFRQRLVSGMGGAPDTRDRDGEFNDRQEWTAAGVLALLNETFAAADRVLAGLSPHRLGDAQPPLRGRQLTVLDVLLIVVTHAAEHVGQVLYIAKLRQGPDYQVVSIPHRRA